jgi:riboflavin kinase/FMN adenylyltransferase
MKLFDFSAELEPKSSVVTVGVYDGVHIGHQFTLSKVLEAARTSGRRSVVATFDRHPAYVVRPDTAPLMLCDLDQRLELLDRAGVDLVAVIPFTLERSQEPPEEFVEEVLAGSLGAGEVIVGENFHFGRDRRGNVSLLEREGARLGIPVTGVHLEAADGDVVSSTRIRQLVAEGEMTHTANLLGRLHEVRGVVARGDGRGGSALGFPTANLETAPELAIPNVGIYAGWYRDDDHEPIPAAISVGRRPTFYESAEPLVEAHLLDFDGDLYGASALVSFGHRLRSEERFESVDALVAQMTLDVEETRQFCASNASLAPSAR